jgi:pimeloyl-ACP methyl ester carboxylesterase
MGTALSSFVAAAVLSISCVCSPAARATDALPALGADPSQVSVSGLSAGAFTAVQYLVAYSGSVVGAGVVAGGPYYCAAGNSLLTGICEYKSLPRKRVALRQPLHGK